MGIELELHSARPARSSWSTSRATLLRGSYEHGDALDQALSTLDPRGSGRLRQVDPYGDTLFGEQEAEAALREIPDLLERCVYESQAAAVRDLAALLTACANTPGSYLWFIGD
ncbi:hypothetical protein ACFV1L_24065 [Kitasatospora sp. NPDC059646]|uniref:hypothetical protein n=1 Tax=Kitasatospora sp. NPDC059646 TaxID=3346893 RepID=UPI003673FBD5